MYLNNIVFVCDFYQYNSILEELCVNFTLSYMLTTSYSIELINTQVSDKCNRLTYLIQPNACQVPGVFPSLDLGFMILIGVQYIHLFIQ